MDPDADGLCSRIDNCPTTANPDQVNSDGDDWGDLCDLCDDTPDMAQVDTDGDGLGDACDICPDLSDADQADTDGDGLGDACDVCPNLSDPDQVDTDGDERGDLCDDNDDNDAHLDADDNCPLNPNDDQADSDAADGFSCGDEVTCETDTGCDWIAGDGSHYLGCLENGTHHSFYDAEAFCVSLGGHLVTINSQVENDWLVSIGFTAMIGLTDQAEEGTFVWADGSPSDGFLGWPGHEPNNLFNEDCTWLGDSGTWNDAGCSGAFVCEARLSDGVGDACDNCPDRINADQTDSDGDGRGDRCDLCPTTSDDPIDEDADGTGDACDNCRQTANADQADADDDGIGDACEMGVDTDGDTIYDDLEIQCGSDPTVFESVPADPDADGLCDGLDNCATIANEAQTDTDRLETLACGDQATCEALTGCRWRTAGEGYNCVRFDVSGFWQDRDCISTPGKPAAQSPATNAPALDPASLHGRKPASSSADTKPACAKKPKKPADSARSNGAAASH